MARMMTLVAAVVLGGSFGTASATVDSAEGLSMVVDIEVEIETSADSVVAHLSFDDEEEAVLPLLARGDGVFGITTELERRNYVVVFEILGPSPALSPPQTLAALGAELVDSADTTTSAAAADDELGEESQGWLWLAVALGAASLSALAFWVLGADRDEVATSEDDGHREGERDAGTSSPG